jgi:hypothetical protein
MLEWRYSSTLSPRTKPDAVEKRERHLLPTTGIETRFFGHPGRSPVTIPPKLQLAVRNVKFCYDDEMKTAIMYLPTESPRMLTTSSRLFSNVNTTGEPSIHRTVF